MKKSMLLLIVFCCLLLSFSVVNAQTLFINEFMASNDTCYADPEEDADDGDPYDDWIEIYNAGTDPVDIGGMYITDDLSSLMEWQIPDTCPATTTIPAAGFLVLWADKEEHQGVLHLKLKLSGGGEQIGLVAADGVTIIDSLTYDEQTADISYGRYPDGSNNWVFLATPTPGATNMITAIGDQQEVQKRADTYILSQNYPNPFNPVTHISYQIPVSNEVIIKVYNLLGKEIKKLVNEHKAAGTYSVQWDGIDNDGHAVSSGVYLYRIAAGNFSQVNKMLLMK